MNPSANFGRVFQNSQVKLSRFVLVAAVAGSLMSCAQIGDEAVSASTKESLASALPVGEPSLGDDVRFSPSTQVMLADNGGVLLNDEAGGLRFELLGSDGFAKLFILTPTSWDASGANLEVNKLSSPDRLVIDLRGYEVKLSKTFEVSPNAMISRVRVGTHPGASRIVLDLAGVGLEHHIEATSTLADRNQAQNPGVVVTIAKPGMMEMALNSQGQLEDTTVAKIAAFSSVVAKAPAVELENSEVAAALPDGKIAKLESQPAKIEAKKAEVIKVAPAPTNVLSSIEIQPIGSSENMLLVQTSNEGKFDLKKTAPSEYVLTVKDVSLAKDAELTLLAPSGGGSIRSVRPVVQGTDVALRIFASPERNLAANGDVKGIVVANTSALELAEARAQMAPEAATPETTTPAATASESETSASTDSSAAAKNASDTEGISAEVAQLIGDKPRYTGRLISLDLQETDIDNALRIIAEVSNLNIIASDDVVGKVTLRLMDVPWDQALDVILKTNGLDKVQEGNVIRIAPIAKLRQERQDLRELVNAQIESEPLLVRYIRVSYAKASEMKPLVESVISERGTVAYDERTNQLIVKDIKDGIVNVGELVSKLDLRTPQVLLETQIVEAGRNILRDLGSELGFSLIKSPATGNATGYNFPNSISVAGGLGAGNSAVSFPAAVDVKGGSAITFLLDSADGTMSLASRITALEREGRARVVSRPSVATTNNKQATIKSVEKLRVKTPDGGLSVATGQGASAGGGSAVATETIEVGIVLEVTPQASPDYYVLLDINAKSSTLGSQSVDGIPSELERSATSSVLVSSGQTFALGGIYKITETDSLDGVPFFKDIPVLGTFFRHSLTQGTDEELLFFITPRVIEGSFDDAAMKVS